MRLGFWRVAVVVAACSVPGCGRGGGVTAPTNLANRCHWHLWIYGPETIEVGASTVALLSPGVPPEQHEDCYASVTSLDWTVTVSGIVSIGIPGPQGWGSVFVTGEAPGATGIEVEVAYLGGSRETVGIEDLVHVVPATTGG